MARMAYIPHDWQAEELITESLLDHIEQGIVNIDTDLTNLDNSFANALEILNNAEQSVEDFNEKLEDLEDLANNVKTDVSNYVTDTIIPPINRKISEAEASINDTLNSAAKKTDIYDDGIVNNEGETSLKAWIEAQITSLQLSISSSQNTITNAITPKLTNIGDIIGSDYNIQTGLTQGTDSISTRLTNLYNSIFGNNSASGISIQEQIQNLNTSIFGSSGGDTSSDSLTNKIETAIGRPLTPTAEQIEADSLIEDSLLDLIKEIRDILGLDGATNQSSSSSLVADVNAALNLLYGYTITTTEEEDPEHPGEVKVVKTIVRNNAPDLNNLNIRSNYPSLYNDFYNTTLTYTNIDSNEPNATKTTEAGIIAILNSLGSDFGKVAASAKEANKTISAYETDLTNLNKAYSKAFQTVIGEDTYLVLSPINQEAQEEEPASNLEQIAEKKSTYVKLPKGGGGGIGSNYYARIENIIRPQNRNISIGDDFIYSFYWMTYQLVGDQTQQEETYGEMKISIDNSVVLTKIIDSGSKTLVNEEYEYDTSKIININLGQYIKTTGRKNISITISANGYADTILSGYVIAYAPNLIIDLNIEQVFSSNTINFPYLATVGSNEVEKILFVEIDGTVISDTNITYLESSYSNASIETPLIDGGHLLTVYFKYRLDENSPLLSSSRYNYGIITNRSSSNIPYIITNLEPNITLTQYDLLSANYMVYGSLSETHNLTISIFNSNNVLISNENLIVTNLTLPQNPWVYAFDEPGSFILQFKIDDNEETKKTYNILVNLNQQYQFILQQPQNLVLNLTPNGRSNQEPSTTRAIWRNTAEHPDLAHSDVNIEMKNFLFSDQNNYDGWLKDENNKPILRLRNTDELKINNCPLLRQIDINTGLTLEIEFKTSDVVNLNTIFFEQSDAGLNVEQQQTNVTNKWNTELQYREDITNLYNTNYNNGEGEYYTNIYTPIYTEILNNLITENNKLSQEEQKTQEQLEDQAAQDAVEPTKNRIFELATQTIIGENARPYEGWTENDYLTEYNRVATEQSIILTPQNFTGNARAKTVLQYKEEELTTISYVFNPTNSGDNSLLIYCYINGILSNIKTYDQVLNQSLNSFIRIGSSECTTDIYAIRLYNTALTSREIVQNWIYGLSNTTEKINAYVRNQYGNAVITDEIFAQHSKGTPYMIIRASGPLESSDAMPQAKGSKFATTVEIRYVDPVNPENSFVSSDTQIQVQGTSSQYYPRKNYKLKMKNFTQNNILHKPENDGDETISTEGYKLFSNSVPVFNFCIKADYASSEGVNNTGLARIYDDIVRNFYKTPAQLLDNNNNIRQAIDGKPMVVFYEEGYLNTETNEIEYKTPYFLGKYNFNNDKGTHEVFGLETFQANVKEVKNSQTGKKEPQATNLPYIGDESWEGADNFYPLNIFIPLSIDNSRGYTKTTDLTTDDWVATFPARFPTVWEDYPEYADHSNWYEAIKWVYSTRTVVWKQNPTTKLYYDAALDENDPDYYVGPENGKTREEIIQEHLTEFKNHFQDYFNLRAMLFFYCFTEFFLMVDNRAKNMFWTRYLTTANRNKDDVLLAGDNQTYDKYFSLPYDFDTAMGIDNQGMFQFNYNLESTDKFMPDGSLIFNGHPSIFWTNFIQVFKEEIGDTFRELLDNKFEDPLYPNDDKKSFRFDYNTIEKRLEDHQSAWSETIFNEDAIFKYIKAHANYFMAQGSKREQRQWWLYNRFRYFTSKYRAAGISSTDRIYMRGNAAGATIKISTIADCYVTFQLGSDENVEESLDTQRILTQNGELELTLPAVSVTNAVINIYPASAIRSISGLSSLLLQTVDFRHAKKIQYLTIGNNNTANTSLTEINISENPLLRHLDVRNCRGFNTSLQLQICSSLETVYLAGTTITSISLPDGGILKTVQYPISISNITISNQPYLQNIIVGNYLPNDEIAAGREGYPIPQQIPTSNYDNILTVSFNNITATKNVSDIIINSINLNDCTLKDLSFTMDGEQFKTLFDKLIEIRQINDEEHKIVGKVNVSNCALYLTSNLPENLTINEITSNFDFKIYTQNDQGEWVEYYNVKFYDFSHNVLITTLSVTAGSSLTIRAAEVAEYFTNDYLNSYNEITEENILEHDTRIGFGGWNKDLTNISEDLIVYPIPENEYRADFYYLENKDTLKIESKYFKFNEEIQGIRVSTFIKDYYFYDLKYWTKDSNTPSTYPDDDNREKYELVYKLDSVESFYAVYKHDIPANYTISIYNTDVNGEQAELLGTLTEKHVIGDSNTFILKNELAAFEPFADPENGIVISDQSGLISPDRKDTPLEDRKYQFLGWQPDISNDGLHVTGDMNIYLRYYKTDDDFTNYFINKLVKCELKSDITKLPKGSFFQNSKLRKLTSSVTEVGPYSFSNFLTPLKDEDLKDLTRYFIFNGDNLYIREGSFYQINNAVIIFTGEGQFTIDSSAFYYIKNCKILLPNSNYPITYALGSSGGGFYNFYGNDSNFIYVKNSVFDSYSNNSSVPEFLGDHVRNIDLYTTIYNQIIEEANSI